MKKFLCWVFGILLWSQPALAIDFVQNVPRQFVIDANFVNIADSLPNNGLTPASFAAKVFKKNKAVVSITLAACVFASSTSTSTGTNPANNDTFTFTGTLDGTLITETYTYKTTLTGAPNEIKIAASASLTLDNRKCTINDSGCVEGTDYGTGTIASILVNATTKTATTLLFVANIPGTVPNSFTTAETSAQESFTGSTLAGGNDNCIVNVGNGKYAAAFPSSVYDTLGDINIDFVYSAGATVLVNWQKGRVVALRSYEFAVGGLGATAGELLNTNQNVVTSSTAWAYKLGTIETGTSDIQSKIGTPAGASVSADVAAVKVDTAAVKVKTDFLPSATAGATGGVFIAGTNAATTVTTAFTSTFTGNLTGSVASVSGAVGSVTGNVGGNVTGNVTGTLGGMTAAALAQFFTVNSGTTYASAVAGSVVKEIVSNAAGSALTVPNIVAGVWDEAIAGHLTAGTTGNQLNAAASAGDPWVTALPGAYVAGSAGFILGTNLNGTVSGRASQTSVDALQADTDDIQTRLPASLITGRMDSNVGAMAAAVLTEAAINANAFTAAKFAADAGAEFAASLMEATFEGAHTFKNFLQYGASALFGKYNSAAGTFNFRDMDDTKNRLIFTTSSTARTSVTRSPD